MSSELDLRKLDQPHEPDPAFVEALEHRLEAILTGPSDDAPPIADTDSLDLYLPAPSAQPDRRRGLLRAVLGAAAALVLMALIAVNVNRDERPTVTTPTAVPANGWVAQSFGNIWLMREGEPDRVVNQSGAAVCPAFSPDGERLMYGTASYAGGLSDARLEIRTVAADGRSRPLTTIPLEGAGGIPCAIWASDGRWAALGAGADVWVVDTETAEVRRLPGYNPGDLEWRPGTDELAITGGNLVGENAPITIYTVSTGEAHTIGDVEAAELSWSPDGSTIAYSQSVQGSGTTMSGITLIDADGGNERTLTTDDYVAEHGIGVVWSPRGDQIAYQRERADCSGAACYELTEVVLVTTIDTDPDTPLGTERAVPPVVDNLHVAPSGDGYNHPPPFRAEPWYANSVTWSPDGTELLYSAWSAGLLVVPIDATRPVTVLSGDGLIGQADDQSTRPWVPLQQWQPAP